MTHKLKRVRVEEYAYYVNKLRPNVFYKHEYVNMNCDATTHIK